MARVLREDSDAVASTVATLFALVIVLLFLQIAVFGAIPARQYEAEHSTAMEALAAFDLLRSAAAGAAFPQGRFTVTVPVGTAAVSPFAASSAGVLQFDTEDVTTADLSYSLVPRIHDSRVTKVDQDVLLLIDSSGSMNQNDPQRLRITGGKDYVGHLSYPDRIAFVDFDSVARLTKANVGLSPHHLNTPAHNGVPNYNEALTDLDTIDQSGGTNFGAAIQVGNNELIANGMKSHAWVEILLTDGQNNFAWQDALARSEAQRAKANGITIFTIGLSNDADAALLQEIAQTTGGTYYAAPTAQSIRFIYFEIAMHYTGAITCGTLTAASGVSGSVSLSLGNARYPSQTLRLEAGGITVTQSDGAVVHQGIPVSLQMSSVGTGALRITLLTFTGPAFRTSGSDYEFIEARFLHQRLDETAIERADLGDQSREVGNISTYLQYWSTQGAATQAAAAAVRAPLEQARAVLGWGDANMTSGKPTLAKFNVDRGQAHLSAAIAQAQEQAGQGTMLPWLARSTEDQILAVGCQLDQWRNWYQGITMTIQSPNAAAWAIWFNDTFRPSGVPISYGTSGSNVVLSLNAIDRLIVDERVIQLSLG